MDPSDVLNYANVGAAYQNLNRLSDAEAVYKQAEERMLAGEYLLQARYMLAFLKGDADQMAKSVSAARGKPGTEELTGGAVGHRGVAREVEERT